MLNSAKQLYLEMLQEKRYGSLSVEALQACFLRDSVEQLGLPRIAIELFLEVKGYDRSPKALQALWASIKQHCRTDRGWMSQEEARASGAWTSVRRVAGQLADV